jgi:hypothetical protein
MGGEFAARRKRSRQSIALLMRVTSSRPEPSAPVAPRQQLVGHFKNASNRLDEIFMAEIHALWLRLHLEVNSWLDSKAQLSIARD